MRVRDEVRVDQIRPHDTAGVVALLVHANRAVHPVVDHEHDDVHAVLHRRGELVPAHQEAAVAGERDDDAFGMPQLRRDRGGETVAHRARRRPERRAEAFVLKETVQPGVVVARAVAHDRVVGQAFGKIPHDVREVQFAAGLAGVQRRFVVTARRTGVLAPAR